MSGRRFLSIFLLSALFVPVAFAAGYKTYTHARFLYAVDYPDDWRVREMGKTTSIYAPRESGEDMFAENVQIVAEDLPGQVSLIDYHRAGVGSAEKFLNGFRALEEARTQWLGRDAIVMLYTATVNGARFKFKDYKFLLGKTAYVLTYTAREADFDRFLPQAEDIMKSIRVSP